MKRTTDSQQPAQRPKPLNPQKLRRLELVHLISTTGVVTLSNATVGNWIAAGCPRNADGTLSLVQVCAWLASERRKKDTGPGPKPMSPTDQLALFKLERERGEYIKLADAVAQLEEAGERIDVVIEAVARNHGDSVAHTIRDAKARAFGNVEKVFVGKPAP